MAAGRGPLSEESIGNAVNEVSQEYAKLTDGMGRYIEDLNTPELVARAFYR
jgi:uncharacterized protein (DUF2252 family)